MTTIKENIKKFVAIFVLTTALLGGAAIACELNTDCVDGTDDWSLSVPYAEWSRNNTLVSLVFDDGTVRTATAGQTVVAPSGATSVQVSYAGYPYDGDTYTRPSGCVPTTTTTVTAPPTTTATVATAPPPVPNSPVASAAPTTTVVAQQPPAATPAATGTLPATGLSDWLVKTLKLAGFILGLGALCLLLMFINKKPTDRRVP